MIIGVCGFLAFLLIFSASVNFALVLHEQPAADRLTTGLRTKCALAIPRHAAHFSLFEISPQKNFVLFAFDRLTFGKGMSFLRHSDEQNQ
ncbi:MAG: hypothetical protein LBS59_02575 [Puniceicoccales bacterium]|nr:hypothetical protein [Puniceicoccales bacterium]